MSCAGCNNNNVNNMINKFQQYNVNVNANKINKEVEKVNDPFLNKVLVKRDTLTQNGKYLKYVKK
jgi:hypothetical protein